MFGFRKAYFFLGAHQYLNFVSENWLEFPKLFEKAKTTLQSIGNDLGYDGAVLVLITLFIVMRILFGRPGSGGHGQGYGGGYHGPGNAPGGGWYGGGGQSGGGNFSGDGYMVASNGLRAGPVG